MNYHGNLWKYFLLSFTGRRNFIPILSVYYLTLPGTIASDIGIYSGFGYIASMFFQIPAGMVADRFGQKNALIIAKLFLLVSSLLFIIADGFLLFLLASIALSLGADAFSSGTTSSFLKGTLEKLGRGGEYRKVASRISGNVALVSIIFIITLPFLTKIDIRLPLIISAGLDMIGLLVAFSLTPVHGKIDSHESKGILILLQEIRGSGFLPFALYSGVIAGFLFADSVYRSPYLVSLGYPLVYIGFVMGTSRLVWWFVGRYIQVLERYTSFGRLILLELFLFPLYYIGASYVTNPWLLGVLISFMIGWFWGRNEIYTDTLMNRIPDARYRATILSVKHQISGVLQVVLSFGIAGVMGVSFDLGFRVLGVIMFFLLFAIYIFGIRRISITTEKNSPERAGLIDKSLLTNSEEEI